MAQEIDSIQAVAARYDVIVFDQWGVLHNGTAPYEGAIAAMAGLTCNRAVLSNSGKRAAPNAERIAAMGFDAALFDHVMTSGEALWQDIAQDRISHSRFHPVERAAGDAADWAEGLAIDLTAPNAAQAILLMGLLDGTDLSDWTQQLSDWRARDLPLYCTNPDRQSPRAGGLVISPGALAYMYREMGGQVMFYGKPHLPVFTALEAACGKGRYLMVGDSLEHDIAGAQTAGWDSLLIQGGLYAQAFATGDHDSVLADLVAKQGIAPPTYTLKELR
jgi:HAD superfamily hydrolase (TIGR01459 family)